MGLPGSYACVKYLLFIFNLIFVITGITVLSVGAVVQGAYNKYERVLDERFFSVPALLIATGAIILIISFFGCCGAVKENHCMIITFSVLLVLIFILELAAGIAGYVLEDAAVDVLSSKLKESMGYYSSDHGYQNLWDGIQGDFHCCGINNYTDWRPVFNNSSLPKSCCPSSNITCTTTDEKGCMMAMGQFVTDNALTLGGVGIGIAIIQFLGIVLACCLARSIRVHYETV